MSMLALERHLLPLMPFLKKEGVTEICINQPCEVFVEERGVFARYQVEDLEYPLLETLVALVAEFNVKDYPAPLIAGSLLNGERIQFVLPPAAEAGKIVCSIRRHRMRDMTLADYEVAGSFAELKKNKSTNQNDYELLRLLEDKNYLKFIETAIKAKKNILISGGTGTGKTTFLNACLKLIPDHERLITVEDTREVKIDHTNSANLLFNENEREISSLNIFKACLRLRPDRIFLSELRGTEVWPYLRAANSGHPGSLSTVHADSPEGAMTQLVFMMQQAGSTSTEEQIRKYIQSIIHVVIQLERDADVNRFVRITGIQLNNECVSCDRNI